MEIGKIARTLALVAASLSAHAFAQSIEPAKVPADVEQYRRAANQGDYNAMRNLAYMYATGSNGMRTAKAGCAWYMAIPYVHPNKIHSGDSGNVLVYCKNLSPTDFDEALRYSVSLVDKLRK